MYNEKDICKLLAILINGDVEANRQLEYIAYRILDAFLF